MILIYMEITYSLKVEIFHLWSTEEEYLTHF